MMIGATIYELSCQMDEALAERDAEKVRNLREDMMAEALRAIASGHYSSAQVAQLCLRNAYPRAERPWEAG